jgi:hypothetical protein
VWRRWRSSGVVSTPEYLKYSGPWCSLYESCFTDAFCFSALTVTDPRRGAGEDLRVARLDLPNAGATLMLAMERAMVEAGETRGEVRDELGARGCAVARAIAPIHFKIRVMSSES